MLARRLGTSRDDVTARALDAFASAHESYRVIEAMNEPDAFGRMAARRVFNRVEG